ncbi:MAG: hypothetical protein A2X77_03195 [Gammaproteobacteria bacterium GWE2_42_36]|nr:MAG: hypothetical protein A2X77_03195 [Gammaproteobacteria bacterium GWE2_42_36]HCU04820.1 hypothetical protein [Coxiellaceae bacterium]
MFHYMVDSWQDTLNDALRTYEQSLASTTEKHRAIQEIQALSPDDRNNPFKILQCFLFGGRDTTVYKSFLSTFKEVYRQPIESLIRFNFCQQENFDVIVDSVNPDDALHALFVLRDGDLLTGGSGKADKNREAVKGHEDPVSVARALCLLDRWRYLGDKYGLLTDENREAVKGHLNPELVAYALDALNREGLLTDGNRGIIIEASDPVVAANCLIGHDTNVDSFTTPDSSTTRVRGSTEAFTSTHNFYRTRDKWTEYKKRLTGKDAISERKRAAIDRILQGLPSSVDMTDLEMQNSIAVYKKELANLETQQALMAHRNPVRDFLATFFSEFAFGHEVRKNIERYQHRMRPTESEKLLFSEAESYDIAIDREAALSFKKPTVPPTVTPSVTTSSTTAVMTLATAAPPPYAFDAAAPTPPASAPLPVFTAPAAPSVEGPSTPRP